jgi:hypothetical protein
MSNDLSVEVLEGAATPDTTKGDVRRSRGALVRKAAAAGGTLAVGGVVVGAVPAIAASARSPRQDVRIFNFLLELEELQSAFYGQALSRGALTGELNQFARVVGAHERAHVAFLKRVLGRRARSRRPQTNFGDATTNPERFIAAARALEDTVVAAFNGQGPNLTRAGLARAARILSVEARHAAWIRAIGEEIPAPVANDPAASEREAVRTLTRTGFRTAGRRA